MPLATLLGLADSPGHAAGFGPLDASDSRALGQALAAQAGTKWCLTVTGPNGDPVAHGCARAGPSPGRRNRPATGPRDRSATGPGSPSVAGSHSQPTAGSRNPSPAGSHSQPTAGPRNP